MFTMKDATQVSVTKMRLVLALVLAACAASASSPVVYAEPERCIETD